MVNAVNFSRHAGGWFGDGEGWMGKESKICFKPIRF